MECHGLHVDTGRWEIIIHLDRKDRATPIEGCWEGFRNGVPWFAC